MLFESTHIGDILLKNRIVALPVFTGYALPDGRVSPLMIEHYRRLARSGACIVVVPNVAVTRDGRTSERSLYLDDDQYINELKRLADVIKAYHSIPCIQLNHAGRYAICDHPMLPSALNSDEIVTNISTLKNFMESFPISDRFGLTTHLAKMTKGWTRQMTDDEIDQTISAFGDAGARAAQAGFEMIELHGATGYLIAQFLSARTNRREPPWGGSLTDRMKFPIHLIREMKNRLPQRMPVGFRLILDELAQGGTTREEAVAFAVQLEKEGVDYLSVTIGTYQTMFLPEIAKQLSRPGYLTSLTRNLKKHVHIPVITSGRILSPALAEKILNKNEADLIGLGRPLIADSKWIKKAKNNKKIKGCKNCNTCFREVALGQSIICERWPKVVQDRIRLENRFASRNGYRTLIVLASTSDFERARHQAEKRAPIHKGILDRQLFLDTGESGFSQAARKYADWSEQFFHTHLDRSRIENIFVDDVQAPVETVLNQLEDQFGFVCIFHDDQNQWKEQIMQKIPAHVVALRGGSHLNVNKVIVPCDLSPFTHMQIRVARHMFHGRKNASFDFVHVSQSPDAAMENWQTIEENYINLNLKNLRILRPKEQEQVADVLLREIHQGSYGCLILGRRGGLAKLRRRIFGSVSQKLLDELPDRTFGIIG